MDDLLDKLRAATEGSRELDSQIYLYLGLTTRPEQWKIHVGLPHYTTSLDAALTLVPEGLQVSHMSISPGRAVALLGPTHAPDFEPEEAKTLPLALTHNRSGGAPG